MEVVAGLIGIVIVLLGMFALGAVFAIWRAFLIQTLWLWLLVPTFALHPLTMPQAYGLSLFVALLKSNDFKYEKDNRKAWAKLGTSFVSDLLLLFIAWILKTYFVL